MYIIGKRKTYVNRFFLVPPSLANFSFFCIVNPLIKMSQNGLTQFKNIAANAARFLKCV